MPLITATDCRLTLGFSHPSADGLASTQIEFSGLDLTPTAMLGELLSPVQDLVQLTCVNAATLVSMTLKQGPEATGPTTEVGLAISGAQGNGPIAVNTAILVRKQVGGVTNRLAGRMFWPFPPTSQINNATGGWTGDALEQFQDAFDDFYAALLALDVSPSIFPKESSDTRPVVALAVQSRPATQRRRLRR